MRDEDPRALLREWLQWWSTVGHFPVDAITLPRRTAVLIIDQTDDDPWALLDDWLRWWGNDDATPAKLPKALQVRTAVALVTHDHDWRPAWWQQ